MHVADVGRRASSALALWMQKAGCSQRKPMRGGLGVIAARVDGVRAPVGDGQRCVGATEDELQLRRREHADPLAGHHLRKTTQKSVARTTQLGIEPVVCETQDILCAVRRCHAHVGATGNELDGAALLLRYHVARELLNGEREAKIFHVTVV
eukprot:scaffold30433_cov26-Tisochrysis_lutea.AAC.1